MKRIWHDYGLSLTLLALFLVTWAFQTWAGWIEYGAEQSAHGEIAQWAGPTGYFWPWARTTLENWQSEFLQLLTFVVLTALLIHKGSPESKDADQEMRLSLQRLEARLEAIALRPAGAPLRSGAWPPDLNT